MNVVLVCITCVLFIYFYFAYRAGGSAWISHGISIFSFLAEPIKITRSAEHTGASKIWQKETKFSQWNLIFFSILKTRLKITFKFFSVLKFNLKWN